MKCAYCGKEARGTREHIISSAILDLFPECYITFDDARNAIHEADPMVKDVCAECNNNRISYIDSYAKEFISKYFVKKYKEDDVVEIEYDYTLIQKMLLKYAYNDMRSRKEDCSFFDEEILEYLMDINNNVPKDNITVVWLQLIFIALYFPMDFTTLHRGMGTLKLDFPAQHIQIHIHVISYKMLRISSIFPQPQQIRKHLIQLFL